MGASFTVSSRHEYDCTLSRTCAFIQTGSSLSYCFPMRNHAPSTAPRLSRARWKRGNATPPFLTETNQKWRNG